MNLVRNNRVDTGLGSLAALAKYFHIPMELPQLARMYVFDDKAADIITLQRAAKDMGIKTVCQHDIAADELLQMPKPLLLQMRGGNYILLLSELLPEGKIFICDPRMAEEAFLADWAKVSADFSGTVMLAKRKEKSSAEGKKEQKFGWIWLYSYVKKYSSGLRTVFGLSVILQLLGLAVPLFTQVIIDDVLLHRSVEAFDVLLLGMLVTTVFQQWLTAVRSYLFGHIASQLDTRLSAAVFQRVLRLPQRYFDRWEIGEITARLGETEKLRAFMTGSSLMLVLDVIFSLVYVGVLFLYSSLLCFVVLVVLPFFALLALGAAPLFRHRIDKLFLAGADKRAFLVETLTGIHTIKNCAVEADFVQKYENTLSGWLKNAFSVVKLKLFTESAAVFLQQIFLLVILWVGAWLVMDAQLTVGKLIAFQMIAGQLIAPVMRLMESWQDVQQAGVSLKRLGDIMNEPAETAWNPGRTTLPDIQGEIRLDNVSFAYKEGQRMIIRNLNLHIPAGLKVGIVGASGSGKSTLSKLIQCMYKPLEGRILIDGVDVAQVEPAWLRRQIGVVLQENRLFAGTLRENISVAVPGASMEEIEKAAELADAATFIQDMPDGYDTFVGEGGGLLSGGQRQRIALARALITNPKILIMDEATSALDSQTEKHVIANLHQIARGRTMLMIAHRLATVKDCDAIIVMEHGHIVEAGPHEELMRRKGVYYRLWQGI